MKKTLNLLIILSCLQFTLFAQNTELLELWQKKDWNNLITTSNAKIRANQSNYQAYYWKQYALLEQGQNADAIEVLKAAFKFCENKLEIRSELANLYFSQGMYLQARTELDVLLKEQRPDFRTFEQRILIHEFSKERIAAINLLHRGNNNDASQIFYWIHLGDNYKQLGEYDDAIKYYEMAMDINPLDYETNSKLARVYLKVDPDAALDVCDMVLEKDSTNIRFIQIAASAYIKIDQEKKALKQYEKALSLGDSTINTMRNAGILYQKFQKSDKALKLLTKAYQVDSTNVKVVFYLAMAESHLFNPDRGLELFDESLKLMRPDSSILSIIHKEKGIIFADKKQHKEALDNYLIAHKLNPKKKFYLYLIAEQYDALDKKKEAIKFYQLVFESIDEKKGLDLLSASIRDYSKSRIDKLKEDLFMEQ
ncbi:tetratricopeptide repeat protein [Ancylomarina sp. YFZ004]